MFALYNSRYPSVTNSHIFHEYVFSSYFFITIFTTKKSTQSVHQIVQFQSQKCKSSLVWEGGHLPPPARALAPSLAFSLEYCRYSCPPPPQEKIPAYFLV